jgi:allophanate hydrolase subunit 1
VGLAGPFTGVYPTASPGGWRLVGRTELTLWDSDRERPATLAPGTVVRFVEVSP